MGSEFEYGSKKIRLRDFIYPGFLYLDTDRDDVLVVFQVNWEKHPPEVVQTKWKTRELLEKNRFHLSLTEGRVDNAIVSRPLDFCPPTHSHKTVVKHCVSGRDAQIAITMELHLMYDHITEKLNAKLIEYPPSTAIEAHDPASLAHLHCLPLDEQCQTTFHLGHHRQHNISGVL